VTDGRSEDQPGWAAPDVTPTEPGPWSAPPAGPPPAPTGWDQPAVPPPPTAAGAPRRKRGKGWLVALLVVLGSIVAMTVAGTVLFITRTLPPYTAAHAFLEDVAHHRDASAARRLCGTDSSPDTTIQGVRADLGNNINTISVNPFGVDRSGDTATVDVSVSYYGGRSTRSFSVPVVDEHGHWKACP
jgi:hypothetical protein